MSKKILIQIGNKLYPLGKPIILADYADLEYHLDKYDVKLLKED